MRRSRFSTEKGAIAQTTGVSPVPDFQRHSARSTAYPLLGGTEWWYNAACDGCPQHFHVGVAEVDPLSGKVMSTSHDYARHEKIAAARSGATADQRRTLIGLKLKKIGRVT